jgi:hypothetical protein
MSRELGLKVLVGVAAVFVASHFPAQAMPPAGSAYVVLQQDSSSVERVHGFHCREELGWDPRAGLYRRHSHRGICEDYKRCLQVHHRCIFIHGRGIDSWKYERWGRDNWRYTNCMLERGCY